MLSKPPTRRRRIINAWAETVATVSAFKAAYGKERRCLIPVDGFCEWRKIGSVKQPYAVGMADDEPFTLAGPWENWKDPIRARVTAHLHHRHHGGERACLEAPYRMPVVVASEDRGRWLTDDDRRDLLKPFPADNMRMWAVSRDVNSAKDDRRDLLDPVAEPQWPEAGNDDVEGANSPNADRKPANSA